MPAIKLLDILAPAYSPCPEFEAACKNVAQWDPKNGFIPRGYLGAHRMLDDVEVILLLAEPGDPFIHETFVDNLSANDDISHAGSNTLRAYERSSTTFHTNMRKIFNLLYPDTTLAKQLCKVWIGETYLCSAPVETGKVPAAAERACASRYLAHQLNVLSSSPIIALGSKAQARVRRLAGEIPNLIDRLIDARAASPPGANSPEAYRSWEQAAVQVRAFLSPT